MAAWIFFILTLSLLNSIKNSDIGCQLHSARDCQEIMEMGFNSSGVYHVIPMGTYKGLDVYCDMDTDDGGWLVFQRRQDGTVDFYRDWIGYNTGFGDVSGEHWLGNQALYAILLQGHYELRIEMSDRNNKSAFASYGFFKIGNPSELYRLTVAEYSGNANDSLSGANGRNFSTKDRDNDLSEDENCAVKHSGGWWYGGDYGCGKAHLNGVYNSSLVAERIRWFSFVGVIRALKRTEMKVRRIL